MTVRDDREVAEHLAAAIDGSDVGEGEAATLAGLLLRATREARFEVPTHEVELALGRVPRPARAGRRRLGPPLAIAAVAVAAAFLLLVVLPSAHTPGVDVVAQARAAVSPGGAILQVITRIAPATPGTFQPSQRLTWIDAAHHREASVQTANGATVEETLTEPGRFVRYQPGLREAVVAPSCRAVASGCAEALDPIELYRRALESAPGPSVVRQGSGDRTTYRLVLPVQAVPGGVTVQQLVTLDASSFLPRRIVWREQRPGQPFHPVSVIDVVTIQHLAPSQVPFGAFSADIQPDTSVRQVDAAGVPVRQVASRRLSLSQARRLTRPVLWLGPSFLGRKVTEIRLVRYTTGDAVRIRYGPVTVWTYDRAIPPPLLAIRLLPAKVVPMDGGVAAFFPTAEGLLAAERDLAGATVAVLAPTAGKIDLFEAMGRARRLNA